MSTIHILGTGAAMVTNCYNTCFTISNNKCEHFLVDTGGGNTILSHLEKSNISINTIRSLFISHTHNDHIMGISWIVRAITASMNKNTYNGVFTIYGEKSILNACRTICLLTLGSKFTKHFDENVIFHEIDDKTSLNILGNDITFFNIHSSKQLQYGFKMITEDNVSFCFLGDEPMNDYTYEYAENSDYLLHEAFCLYEEKDIFSPYEKHHSTVKEACENAVKAHCKNLILVHTMDNNISERKCFYKAEADYFCNCNVIVPDDLDIIDLIDEASLLESEE